jgi:hypothetical protein
MKNCCVIWRKNPQKPEFWRSSGRTVGAGHTRDHTDVGFQVGVVVADGVGPVVPLVPNDTLDRLNGQNAVKVRSLAVTSAQVGARTGDGVVAAEGEVTGHRNTGRVRVANVDAVTVC